ncbi:MAG: peptide chain release factor 2 [Patescibacteria group bacterium]
MAEYKKQLAKMLDQAQEIEALLEISNKKIKKDELENIMKEKNFWQNQEKAKQISQKYESLNKEIQNWQELFSETKDLFQLSLELEKKYDAELNLQIEEQIKILQEKYDKIEFLAFMSGKHDQENAIISIHAGSGGTDAQDWTEILLRMYLRYAEKKSWKSFILDETFGNEAGLKSVSVRITGNYVYGFLKSEQGTHRLVRISPFDAEKMRHTSFALVEVIPEIENSEIEINEKDLRIDTFMSGGHGGQSVNTTYSAVRITHVPSGISVSCQNERSQLQNKLTALKILKAKLQKIKEIEEENKIMKLKGDYQIPEWGSQIRSYVLNPYKLVKDLRSEWETTDTEKILDGDLDEIIVSVLKNKK